MSYIHCFPLARYRMFSINTLCKHKDSLSANIVSKFNLKDENKGPAFRINIYQSGQ